MNLSVQVVSNPLPVDLEDQVWSLARNGNVSAEMASKKVDWFHAYLWSGDATGSVLAVDFGDGDKEDSRARSRASRRGHFLVKQFYPLIVEAVQVRRAASEPLALKVHEDILNLDHTVPVKIRLSDGSEQLSGERIPDAKILAVKQKAAESILDRGVMPKGMALHGSITTGEDKETRDNWAATLDMLVGKLGVEAVWGLPVVKGRVDMQEYLGRKYPKVVSIQAETVE